MLGTTSTTPADVRLDVDIIALLAPYGGVTRRVLMSDDNGYGPPQYRVPWTVCNPPFCTVAYTLTRLPQD